MEVYKMAVYFGQEKGLGDLLGAGLGKGLGALISQKMERIQKRSGLEALGLTPEKASGLSKLQGKSGEIALQQELRGQQQSQNLQNYMKISGMSPALEAVNGKPTEGMKVLASGGNVIQALAADRDSAKLEQKERFSEEKKKAESKRIKEARITTGLNVARGEAKDAQGRVESYRESAENYKNIRRLLKSGKPITGLPMVALKHFGIDKSVSGWETQLMDKAFAAEPIRALRSLPPQAARLTKVFDTLKDMHGSLINTPEGLDAIARTKIVEAKAAKAVDKAYISMLESHRKKGKDVPFDLRAKAAKTVSEKLNIYGSEIQYIISDSIVKGGAKLSEFKFGEKIIADDGSGRVFVKKKVFGRPTWVTFESE